MPLGKNKVKTIEYQKLIAGRPDGMFGRYAIVETPLI
jgi:hypothetical protein